MILAHQHPSTIPRETPIENFHVLTWLPGKAFDRIDY
jgi:hypothetical protein